VFDRLKDPYTLVRNSDVQKGDLGQHFDTIVFASQSTASILHGYRAGEIARQSTTTGETPAIAEARIHREASGLPESPHWTRSFAGRQTGRVRQRDRIAGATVRAAASAAVTSAEATASNSYYCPGSILRMDVDGTQMYAFMSGGQAWDIALAPSENKGRSRGACAGAVRRTGLAG
jgi:hypothetical protein